MQRRVEDKSYAITRLDLARNDSWAVIGVPSGAIASNQDDSLMLRLTRDAAQKRADELNLQLRFGGYAQKKFALELAS